METALVSSRAQVVSAALDEGTRPITEAAVLERGKFTHRPRNDARFFGGEHPWIQIGEIESSSKYIEDWTQTLNDEGLSISRKFPRGTLLISIAATIGAVGILGFDCCVPDSIVAITPREGVDSEFIYYYLGFLRTNLEQVAPQSAQKNINLRILSALPFPTVPLDEQRRIVAYLDAIQARVDRLKALQEKTAAELDALLHAILDKAFKGELVESETIRVAAPAKATPVQPAIAKPRKHSKGIYFKRGAIATYIIKRLHRRPQFGRVMFEKCLYLAEAYVGVDLEGQYKRAAAGPLDAEYLHKLESLAAKQHWFAKRKSTGGTTRYAYRPDHQAPERLTATAGILGGRRKRMDHLLDLMSQLNTERAEIVATLFAAWNDLLMAASAGDATSAGPAQPSDDKIIAEVHERWHEAKQRFDKARLIRALEWMRDKGLVPLGVGPRTQKRGARDAD